MISLESLRERGATHLSANRIAGVLDMRPEELARFARVHVDVLRFHPESIEVQRALHDIARVLELITLHQPDITRVVFHLKNTPLATFGQRTLLEVLQAGRVEDAIAYLESVLSGAAG